MGAGKTQVGKALAKLMKVAFVDSDREIEKEAGATIPEIFAREGESGFRAREARAIDRITLTPGPAVLSTGGGAAATSACAAMLVERCLVVWLYVSPKTAATRAHGGGTALAARPLLAGGDPEARLVVLEAERRGAYASSAELVVSTEGRGAAEAAEVIHDEISRLS
jgi:shikimate kinase